MRIARRLVLSLLLPWWLAVGGKPAVHARGCAAVALAPAVLVLRGGAEQGPRACDPKAQVRGGGQGGFRIADHQYPVTALAVMPGGGAEEGGEELLISADGSGLIIVWETSTFRQLAQLKGHKLGVASMALRKNELGSYDLFSGGYDNNIWEWSLVSMQGQLAAAGTPEVLSLCLSLSHTHSLSLLII